MKLLATIVLAITLNNAALFAHWQYSDTLFQQCLVNNMLDSEIEDCMNKDLLFRVGGTILFTEGSYLE